jgi:uncharacterized membrane protein
MSSHENPPDSDSTASSDSGNLNRDSDGRTADSTTARSFGTKDGQGILDRNQPRHGFWHWLKQSFNPFRIATLRGIGIVLPPLLTIIFFLWVWNTLDKAILTPVESIAQQAVFYFIDETIPNAKVRKAVQAGQGRFAEQDGERIYITPTELKYVQIKSNWIPLDVAEVVRDNAGKDPLSTAKDYYLRYIRVSYLKRHLVIPAFLALFIALLYLIGKLLAVRLGRMIYLYFEGLVNRLPLIRNVYSSVKQVTDFAFNEQEVQFNRVVAVEYPRKGVWSIGFVTGEGFAEVAQATGEPMLSLLMPTSPMPATGFTITVPKSQTIDLDLSIDQAIQFCVSCGVVIPDHQSPRKMIEGIAQQKTASLKEPTN